jgi:hypothetical protein
MQEKPKTNPFDCIGNTFNSEGAAGQYAGLWKREYFAALIMQGLVVPAIAGIHNINDKHEALHKAQMAVNLADALIEALNK